MSKLLIICGPTATGKTDIGVRLAHRLNGEIISADSRQVYRGMDIGTGKDIPVSSKFKSQNAKFKIKNKRLQIGFREKDGIPIWLVDIVKPDYRFNVGEYADLAQVVVQDIQQRNKLPILVGGTGLYIRSVVEPLTHITVPPNQRLRKKLESLNIEELQGELRGLNESKLENLNQSDRQNPRRLVRAIEIAAWHKKHKQTQRSHVIHDLLLIGLTSSQKNLFERIDQRVEVRFKSGMADEVRSLLHRGYNWTFPSMTATGYRQEYEFIFGKKDQIQTIQDWQNEEHQYAKRQLTWFKKYPQIKWFDIAEKDCQNNIFTTVKKWYNSN